MGGKVWDFASKTSSHTGFLGAIEQWLIVVLITHAGDQAQKQTIETSHIARMERDCR
jgi:hypothetical protein